MKLTTFILGVIGIFATTTAAFADFNIILLRHALAPGFGDPVNFQLDDCDTQRLLNAEGRLQAREIGKNLLEKGLKPTRILTSPWCRCIQTAEELGLGAYEIHHGLSSFYEGHVSKEESLPSLRQEFDKIGPDELVLVITHQVVIQALSGRYVESGGYILANSKQISWP